jgi:PAS domain S-box-containing protein
MTSQATEITSGAASAFEALLALDPAVLEAIPAAVYVCAADGRIVRFNQRAAELWGRTPEVGVATERFCAALKLRDLEGRELPHARSPMAMALRTGEPQRDEEVLIERPDGSRIVAAVQIDTLKDRYGRVQGAINCFQDITQRKRMEVSLARRMEEQAALYRITDSLHRAQSLGDIYDSALDAILRALPCERASILLFDQAGVMRFVAWRGLSDAYRRAVDGHSPWTPAARDDPGGGDRRARVHPAGDRRPARGQVHVVLRRSPRVHRRRDRSCRRHRPPARVRHRTDPLGAGASRERSPRESAGGRVADHHGGRARGDLDRARPRMPDDQRQHDLV